MIEALTTKRVVLCLVLAGAVAILVSGSREWVSGSVDDVALGAIVLHGNGSDVAPVAVAAALVGIASAVAVVTSGAVVRAIAACAALLAALLALVVVVGVIADPDRALGTMAAVGTGRTGTVVAHGRVGGWAWVALVATVFMAAGGLGGLFGGRHWRGLSDRYDSPSAGRTSIQDAPVDPAPGRDSAWDQLSRGEDPTAEHRDLRTEHRSDD